MTANSQLLTTTPKQKQEQTNQTTRTGTEPQKWRSHGGLSTREWGNRKRTTEMETTGRVINRGVGGGESGERYRKSVA